MKVLVASASKYGSTNEIARAIGGALADRGVIVQVAKIQDVSSVEPFDAVVLGSAVYAGQWMKVAREFVDTHALRLTERPVWLFSSGPIGSPPLPPEDNIQIDHIVMSTGAREHKVFAGKLDRSRLTFAHRALVRALKAPDGDFRDWNEIDSWGGSIAEVLRVPAPA